MPKRRDPHDPYFRDNFNTPLTPEEEQRFALWATLASIGAKRSLLSDLQDYDLRGAWKAGWSPASGHGPDIFKKPNHPTFSVESIWNGDGWKGGEWGNGTFAPSLEMLASTHSLPALAEYLRAREPDVQLLVPQKAK